jgi:hypothetical protein
MRYGLNQYASRLKLRNPPLNHLFTYPADDRTDAKSKQKPQPNRQQIIDGKSTLAVTPRVPPLPNIRRCQQQQHQKDRHRTAAVV